MKNVKKLESLKNDMFALNSNTTKLVIGGMPETWDYKECIKNGKKVQDRVADTNNY